MLVVSVDNQLIDFHPLQLLYDGVHGPHASNFDLTVVSATTALVIHTILECLGFHLCKMFL